MLIVLRRRIRIDLEDDDGVKFDIKLEGDITREKLLRVYDMVELFNTKQEEVSLDTVGSKIWHVIDKYFTPGNFTSTMVLEKYEDEYNEPIKLSVISTYLGRFSARTKLSRRKMGRGWTYTKPIMH